MRKSVSERSCPQEGQDKAGDEKLLRSSAHQDAERHADAPPTKARPKACIVQQHGVGPQDRNALQQSACTAPVLLLTRHVSSSAWQSLAGVSTV